MIAKNEKGLTLVELLAVLVIVGIIAAIAVPAIGGVMNKAKIGKVDANASGLYDSIVQQAINDDLTSKTYNDKKLLEAAVSNLNKNTVNAEEDSDPNQTDLAADTFYVSYLFAQNKKQPDVIFRAANPVDHSSKPFTYVNGVRDGKTTGGSSAAVTAAPPSTTQTDDTTKTDNTTKADDAATVADANVQPPVTSGSSNGGNGATTGGPATPAQPAVQQDTDEDDPVFDALAEDIFYSMQSLPKADQGIDNLKGFLQDVVIGDAFSASIVFDKGCTAANVKAPGVFHVDYSETSIMGLGGNRKTIVDTAKPITLYVTNPNHPGKVLTYVDGVKQN